MALKVDRRLLQAEEPFVERAEVLGRPSQEGRVVVEPLEAEVAAMAHGAPQAFAALRLRVAAGVVVIQVQFGLGSTDVADAGSHHLPKPVHSDAVSPARPLSPHSGMAASCSRANAG